MSKNVSVIESHDDCRCRGKGIQTDIRIFLVLWRKFDLNTQSATVPIWTWTCMKMARAHNLYYCYICFSLCHHFWWVFLWHVEKHCRIIVSDDIVVETNPSLLCFCSAQLKRCWWLPGSHHIYISWDIHKKCLSKLTDIVKPFVIWLAVTPTLAYHTWETHIFRSMQCIHHWTRWINIAYSLSIKYSRVSLQFFLAQTHSATELLYE